MTELPLFAYTTAMIFGVACAVAVLLAAAG
jgi:hypothetical protein